MSKYASTPGEGYPLRESTFFVNTKLVPKIDNPISYQCSPISPRTEELNEPIAILDVMAKSSPIYLYGAVKIRNQLPTSLSLGRIK